MPGDEAYCALAEMFSYAYTHKMIERINVFGVLLLVDVFHHRVA
jgi:hypothetical protein